MACGISNYRYFCWGIQISNPFCWHTFFFGFFVVGWGPWDDVPDGLNTYFAGDFDLSNEMRYVKTEEGLAPIIKTTTTFDLNKSVVENELVRNVQNRTRAAANLLLEVTDALNLTQLLDQGTYKIRHSDRKSATDYIFTNLPLSTDILYLDTIASDHLMVETRITVVVVEKPKHTKEADSEHQVKLCNLNIEHLDTNAVKQELLEHEWEGALRNKVAH